MRTLFVCRGNLCRSRVAEDIFRVLTWRAQGQNHYEVRSAGTKADPGGHQITTQDVEWADVICVMEQEQEAHIRRRWPAQADKIRVLGIPDIFERGDETLQTLLTDVVRTLLADGSPQPPSVDSAPPRQRRLRSGSSRWRSAGAIAALVAVVAIVGYLIGSRVEPEQPVSSARTSSELGPSVAPDVTVPPGPPAGRNIPSDQTEPAVPVPSSPTDPTSPVDRAESPMAASEGPTTRSAEILAELPSGPPVTPPPQRPRPPVALPPPARVTPVMGQERGGQAPPIESSGTAPVGGRARDGDSRQDADAADPGAIIDWVLREYPARR